MAKVALIPSAVRGTMPMVMCDNFGQTTTALTKYYLSMYFLPIWDPMDEILGAVTFLITAASLAMVAKFVNSVLWIRLVHTSQLDSRRNYAKT
jgi:hypothetical protein